MKRFANFKKTLAIVLALLTLLSSFSIVASAADYEKVTVTPYDSLISENEREDTATPDIALLSDKKNIYVTGAGAGGYHMYSNTSYGLRFKPESCGFTFKNQITGETINHPSTWGAWEYEYAKKNNDVTAVWCIQPGVAINGAEYHLNDNGDSEEHYWKKLKSKTNLYKAMAAVVAFGKKHNATENNAYHYAVQALLWDFVTGARDPKTYKVNTGKRSMLSRAYHPLNSKKYDDVVEAQDVILTSMKNMRDTPAEILNKQKRIYSTDGNLGKFLTDLGEKVKKMPNDREKLQKALVLEDKKKTGTYSNKFTVKKLEESGKISYRVVNQNGNTADSARGFNLKLDKSKSELNVSTTSNLDTLAKDGHYFFVEITKKVPSSDYVSSGEDMIWQSGTPGTTYEKQTMLNSLKFDPPAQTAYVPLFTQIDPKNGSLLIKKEITTSVTDVDYNGDYSGWYFSAKNKTTGKTTVLETDDEGITDTIEGIESGTEFEIKELGRLISASDNKSDFHDVTTVSNGKTYGIPNDFTNYTGTLNSTKAKTVKVSGTQTVEVTWTNKCDLKMPVVIQKEVTDNNTKAGYYFLVLDVNLHLIEQPKIVGPTNNDGEVEFYLDRPYSSTGNTFYVVELGQLSYKGLEEASKGKEFAGPVSIEFILNGDYKNYFTDYFKIPSQYKSKDGSFSSAEQTTGIKGALPVTIKKATDLNDFYEEPYTYKKYFSVVNVAEGYVRVKKTDAISGKPVKDAVYNIYPIGMNETIGDDDEPVASIITDANGEGHSELIPIGDYYIREESCSANYHLDKKIYKIKVGSGQNYLPYAELHNFKDYPTQTVITKRESSALGTNGTPLANCVLQIFEKPSSGSINYSTAKPVYEFTTKTSSENIEGKLELGKTYILHEKSCPPGYCLADDVEFTVKDTPGSPTTLSMYDKTTKVKFVKVDSSTNKNMADVTLQIQDNTGKPVKVKDYDGKLVESWVTRTEPLTVEGILESGKSYKLVELKTKAGYTVAAPVPFTVRGDGELQTVTMYNKTTKVKFVKVDSSTNKNMADVTLQIQDSAGKPVKVKDYNGTLVESWVTRTEPLTVEGILESGKSYKLVELKTKAGYTVAAPVPFTVRTDGQLQTVTMKNVTTKFKLSKKDITGTEEIPGCTIELKEKGATTTLLSWVSTTEPKYLEGVLEVGKTYVMTETIPVDGCVTAESIEFTVQNNGNVQTVVMKDDTTKIKILKLDSSTKNNVSNALLQIQDSAGKPVKVKDYDGNLVESWRTRNTPLTIVGTLAINKTYKLVELESPVGYAVAKPVQFTVQDTGNVQSVTMYDDTTKITFEKVAKDTNKLLPGCVLSLTDSKGNEVKRWTTTDKAYHLNGVLKAGETYTLTEISAAKGYMKAEPITFKVNNDGKEQVITMYDKKFITPTLPKTGGNGFLPFIIFSTACFAAAGCLWFVQNGLRKKNKSK